MKASRYRLGRLILFLFSLVTLTGPTIAADFQPLDSIVAVVDDDVVLRSELDVKLAEIQAQAKSSGTRLPAQDVLERQVLEHLINQKVQLAAAQRLGVKVDDAMITAAMARLAQQNGLTPAEFGHALESTGVSEKDFRNELSRQLLIARLHAQEVVNKIVVTDQEVEAYLADQAREGASPASYHLFHILIATPDGASPEQIKKAQDKAEQLVSELRQGADFREMALTHSDDQQALQGGDLGWMKAADMPNVFAEAAAKMGPGDVSDPIRSASGFHVLKLEAVQGGAGKHVITQTHARHILIQTNELVSDSDAKIRLSQLRARILGGEDFETLARSHSDDKASAIKGGDMGWVSPGDTVAAFDEQMARLQPNQISEPFRTQFGWHIVQVLGRRQYDSTDEVRTAEAREAVRNRKAKEQIELFDRTLRDQAYVEIHLDQQ